MVVRFEFSVVGYQTRWFKDWKIEWLKDFDLQKQFLPEVLEFGPEACGYLATSLI
jgi:hypothetical protein